MSVFRPLKGKCVCGGRGERCVCPRQDNYSLKFLFQGKQIIKTTGTPDVRLARKYEAEQKRAFRQGAAVAFLQVLRAASVSRSMCTIGDIVKAYQDEGVKLLNVAGNCDRNVSELYQVIAYAKNLWRENTGGVRGVKLGAMMPDRERIDALSASVLTRALVKDYYRARQGGTLNVAEAEEGNRTINSSLNKARSLFSARALSYKLEGLELPDLAGFMKEPFLPTEDKEPQPIKEAEFAKMLAAAQDLGSGKFRNSTGNNEGGELALVNMILRQTGMRSGSVEALHRDWLEDLRSGPVIHVRVRKGGTALYSLPISEDLAAVIRSRPGFTVLPDGSPNERHELVHTKHNAWLKAIIGGAGERVQGNHRMRDTVATILLTWLGIEAAKLALGHADERVTLKHYGRLRIDVSDAMRHELRAFAKVAEGNVVEFKTA
jgi:integrase